MMQKLSITEACQYLKKLLSMNYSLACVGTYLRSDDAVCLELCDRLQSMGAHPNIVKCEFGLENCIDVLLLHKFDGVLICDAVISSSLEPGSIVKLGLEDIDENIWILSTHSIPLTHAVNILSEVAGVKNIELLGIVACDLSIGMQLSEVARTTIDKLCECLKG
jgi:hydrogenase 3 maturation protease